MSKPRDIILRRRARFLGVALAGVGMAASIEGCRREPQVCLSAIPTEPDAGPFATATPCLSAPIDAPDAGADAGTQAEADAGDAGTPRPCLTPPQPKKPPPRVCLSVLRHPEDVEK